MLLLYTEEDVLCAQKSYKYTLYRTNGVSIFIDYCTAPRDTQKGGRRRKRPSTSTRE
jgi:hypothetical protein